MGKPHYKSPFSIAMLNYQRVHDVLIHSDCIHFWGSSTGESLGWTATEENLLLREKVGLKSTENVQQVMFLGHRRNCHLIPVATMFYVYIYIYIGLSFLIHKWLKLPFGCSFAMQPLAKYAEVSKHGASRAKKESQERTECVSGQGYRALMGSVWPKKMGGNQRTSPWHRRTKWESVNGKIMSNGKISYIFIEGL